MRRVIAGWVERRLGGYRHLLNEPRVELPLRLARERRVAVIGAGIAGLAAASTLAERGFAVTVFEKNRWLGGKVGSWPVQLPPAAGGGIAAVEHGFHAFFRQYYNLNGWLGRIGADARMVAIPDYTIVTRDGRRFGFKDIDRTPVLNMLSMARAGVYRIGEMVGNPESRRLLAFLSFDGERTYELYDTVSYKQFADDARLPPSLRLIFNTFSRAFFADARLMSMAEMIKSFHSYFLSNDAGLLYDYPDDDYGVTLLEPARAHLERHGARLHLDREVGSLGRSGASFVVDGDSFDAVVLAADVKGVRAIAQASPWIAAESPELHARLRGLKSSQRYSVLRFWTDRPVAWDLPPFVITEKARVLDSISVYPMIEAASAAWARQTGGGVYELHCYSVPDDVGGEDEVRRLFYEELYGFFPAFRPVRVLHEHLQLRDDFTAYHTGLRANRPECVTPVPGLVLAGDWVKTRVPAMLMEAACTSALLASNALLEAEGLRPEPVYSVPPRGLMAGRRPPSAPQPRSLDKSTPQGTGSRP